MAHVVGFPYINQIAQSHDDTESTLHAEDKKVVLEPIAEADTKFGFEMFT